MKILFLSDNFPPEVNAPASRTFDHCSQWVKQGVDVTVITCFPNFPKGEIYPGYKNKLFHRENVNGIKVIRVWSYITPNEGFFKRIIDYISYAIMAFVFGLFQKFDVVIGTSPQFFTAVSARSLSLCKFRPWIMEVRDLWPETIATVGSLKKTSFVYKVLEKIELNLYKTSKIIVTNADGIKSSIVDRGIDENKIKVVKNGVDIDICYRDVDLSQRDILNLDDKIVISYCGTLGMCHALDFIIGCFKNIENKNIHLLVIGDGAEKDNLFQMTTQLGLENVTFLPSVTKNKVYNYIAASDYALVNLKKSETFTKIIPSKIFENILMKKPILLGVEGEAKELIEYYKVGVCYEPENESSFHEALKRLDSFWENNPDFDLNCSKMLHDFDRKKLAKKMLEFIKNI